MRYAYTLLVLTLLVLVQSTFLHILIPWLPLNLALLFLIVLAVGMDRTSLLFAGVWTGFVQDILYGEALGLFMLANFIALALVWELKDSLMENPVLTTGLRLVVASLTIDLLMTFIYYIYGLESGNLLIALQLKAGINLVSNLLLYLLLLTWLRLRGSGKITAVLEARK